MSIKWNFRLLFYSKFKSMILWFLIFESGLRTSVYEFFLELQSWPIRVKMCDIRRAVKICKLVWLTSQVQNLQEGNKRRSGKIFVTGGPFLASCKTPLTPRITYKRVSLSKECHCGSRLPVKFPSRELHTRGITAKWVNFLLQRTNRKRIQQIFHYF